jgi:hypothetical protein
MFYTYAHTRNDTNKIFYIGKGVNNRAWVTHGRNKHWNHIVKKHGHTVKILAEWKTEKEALDHEILLISCFKDLGYLLVNMTDGGDNPPLHKGEEHHWFGKGILRSGKNHPNFKGVIVATNIKTKEKTTFYGLGDCAALGFSEGNISECVNGKRKTHKGHTFERITEVPPLSSASSTPAKSE